MKRKPLVSIIIPVFNEERYLHFCLESLLKQTYSETEIIVVDDGSSDESYKVVTSFPVLVFQLHHSGPAVARNFGAEKSKGSILAFLDADMKYDTHYIERLVEPIVQKKLIGTCGTERVANSENIISQCWSINSDFKIGQREPENSPIEINIFRAIKKDAFIQSGGFTPDEGYTDDNSISRKLHQKALVVKEAIAYHYNPETLSEVFLSARWIGRSRILFKPSLKNLLRFSIVNSVRNAIKKIQKGAPRQFLFFKLVYDFGIFCGIFLSFGKLSK